MRRVEKKVVPPYFDLIQAGKKTYEWRLDDFEVAEGDVLVLREWNPASKEYTGREMEKTVGYVGKWHPGDEFWSMEEVQKTGFQVISLV